MSEQLPVEERDERLRRVASSLDYPPTPDIARAVRVRLASDGLRAASRRTSGGPMRRLAWVALAVLAVGLLAVLVVPEAQAFVRALLRIGSIEIVVATPTPIETPGSASTISPVTATPVAGAGAGTPAAGLGGDTTLEAAQQRVNFPILVPSYPPDLGEPQIVFARDLNGPMAVLGWRGPEQGDHVRMALYELSSDAIARKLVQQSTILEETTVRGNQALWLQGPHLLEFMDPGSASGLDALRIDESTVLLWEEGIVTYRLESTLSLQEAVRVAESLRPAFPTFEPQPTPLPTVSGVLNMGGETTLEAARRLTGFPVRLPSYPANLGPPDRVFVRDLGGTAVILAWLEEDKPANVKMSLHLLATGVRGSKSVSSMSWVHNTTVRGHPAAWIDRPHVLEYYHLQGLPEYQIKRLVDGNVLVWVEDGLTYRLETPSTLAEALRIAQSLR
jgi:hypothetical protein